MSRSKSLPPDYAIEAIVCAGRTRRGVSKLERKFARQTRHALSWEIQQEEPQLQQPKRIRNFWREWL